MNKLMPTFCGINIDTNAVVVGSLIEEDNPGYHGPSLFHGGDHISVPATKTFEILESCGDSSFDSGYVYPNTIAMHMFDMPEGCFVALNEKGLCGSMFVEGDESGLLIYALVYHDGGIKPKIVYSTFHKAGYKDKLTKRNAYSTSKLHEMIFVGQYTGEESIASVLSSIGAKE